MFPSNQVGGMGYGYANGGDVSTFGGSYAPISSVCGGDLDKGRGGNNVMAGGRRSRRKNRSSRRKKGGKKRTKKWWQKGCKKMRGGLILV